MSLDKTKGIEYINIDARGTIIKTTYETIKNIPIILSWYSNWNKSCPFYIDMNPDKVHTLLDNVSEIKEDYFCCEKKDILEKTEHENIYRFIIPEYKIVFYEDVKFPTNCLDKFSLFFNDKVIKHCSIMYYFNLVNANRYKVKYGEQDDDYFIIDTQQFITKEEFYDIIKRIIQLLQISVFEQLINRS